MALGYQFDPQQLPVEQVIASEDHSPGPQTSWAWWQSAIEHRFDDQGLGAVISGGESYLTIIALTAGRLPKFVSYVEDEFFGLTLSSLEEELVAVQIPAASSWSTLVVGDEPLLPQFVDDDPYSESGEQSSSYFVVSSFVEDEYPTPPILFGVEDSQCDALRQVITWTPTAFTSDDVRVEPPTTIGGESAQLTTLIISHNGRSRAELSGIDEYPTPPAAFGLDDSDLMVGQKTRIPWRMCVFLGGDIGVRVMPFDDEVYESPRRIVTVRYSSFVTEDDEPTFVTPVLFGLLDESPPLERQKNDWTVYVFQDDEIRVAPALFDDEVYESSQHIVDARYASFTAQDDESTFVVVAPFGLFDELTPSLTTYDVRSAYRRDHLDDEISTYVSPPMFDDEVDLVVSRTYVPRSSFVFLGDEVFVAAFDDDTYVSITPTVVVSHLAFKLEDDERIFTPIVFIASDDGPSIFEQTVHRSWIARSMDEDESIFASFGLDDHVECPHWRQWIDWRSSFSFVSPEELEFDRFDVPCVTLMSDGFSLVLMFDGFSSALTSDGFDAELSDVRCDC